MTSQAWKVVIGATIYFLVALSLYGLRFLAGGGPIPIWFAIAKALGEAVLSVGPGFLVGWLSRERGFMLGAAAGAIGALVSTAAIFYHWNLPPPGGFVEPMSDEVFWHLIPAFVLIALAAALTNAIGGIAGAALRRRAQLQGLAP